MRMALLVAGRDDESKGVDRLKEFIGHVRRAVVATLQHISG